MKAYQIWNHFSTITRHKMKVMKYCFRLGMYKQGILHDLSKYGPLEFVTGAVLYQGNRSPNAAEREQFGFSKAWLHHKGRNKHHFEYWIDYSMNPELLLVGHKMPLKYVLEMVVDRIAASQIYQGENYTDEAPFAYYNRSKERLVMHKDTKDLLEYLLVMLKEKGEDTTFSYMKQLKKRGRY